MALNMSPEKGVKLTKKDRNRLKKKIQRGWKSKIILPDFKLNNENKVEINSDRMRRAIKIVKIKEDSIYIEKVVKNKDFKITWDKISYIHPSKNLKDAIKVNLINGLIIEFSLFNAFKVKQNRDYVINLINKKKIENNSNISMHN